MRSLQSKAEFFGGVPGFPIPLAVRAGDHAYTATLGARTFKAETAFSSVPSPVALTP